MRDSLWLRQLQDAEDGGAVGTGLGGPCSSSDCDHCRPTSHQSRPALGGVVGAAASVIQTIATRKEASR